MKKILSLLFVALLAINSNTIFAKSTVAEKAVSTEIKKNSGKEEYFKLEARVKEIRDMDKKNLTAEQRQALRAELIGMKQSLSHPDDPWGPGIYLSSGAIIMIIIILIVIT